MKTIRTNSRNNDFIALVQELDADLAIRDGDEHAFYAQFNTIDHLNHVLVLYLEEQPVGCGAIKEYDTAVMEIKRMYVKPDFRGQVLATKILMELEIWAKELGAEKCILETGLKQPEAIALYLKNQYYRISNYGQYQAVENSVCFEKKL
ncbi:GNAT family N-acetyltransferase [Marinifilum caeruleilacunae]|uniref:GNAT family N-acetyltransferase n=1 Tax=Marinifilum caeruleilacunae TaxID=2499076 RepID=A0ABX1WT41_9BACT|nr:GNAT family N-acetyltransferase [Marinifilum caeruleilacunae]NOU59078.1 GNAT family N-acetyltransferase [Marinifilum caeruleilacunae]